MVRLRSFRSQLLALVLLVIVPAFLLVLIGNIQRLDSERRRAIERAVTIAKLAATTENHYIKETRQLLATLAQFDFLVLSTNRAGCEWHLKNLKLLSPDFNDFGIIETNGTLFCDTFGNRTEAIAASHTAQNVVNHGSFVFSEYVIPGVAAEPALQFGFPVRSTNGQIVRVLYASLKTPPLSTALAELPLPDPGVVNVLDSKMRLIARHPDREKAVGGEFGVTNITRRIQAGETVFESPGLDGIKRLFAVSPISDGSTPILFAAVGIPSEISFATANKQAIESLLLMLLMGGLVLWIAWWFSERRFLRPVHAMLDAAQRLTGGDLTARTGISANEGELHLLGAKFDEMAATLEKRQEEILRKNTELEERVCERTKELATLNAELEAFSYSVSHDLRAPLRHMDGFAQLLLGDPKHQDDPQTSRYLSRITNSAKQMGTLIDELLSFSRMTRQSMMLADVNSDDLVAYVIKELSAKEGERKIAWQVDRLPNVKADLAMLRQVWINLISNALKYTRGKEPAVISVKASREEAETIFCISDNGAGFDMAYVDKLFGVFQRLHRDDEFEGTGIGLANVRRIVQRHGGRTWAEGEVGQGAKFFFSVKN
jgi:signal transduction histidine kinase